MSSQESASEPSSRGGTLGKIVKGAAGAVVVAVGGYLGAAALQVLSAPKDSVAYDLIQSTTGWLRTDEKPVDTRPKDAGPKPDSKTPPARVEATAQQPAPTQASSVAVAPERTAALAPRTSLPEPPQTSAPVPDRAQPPAVSSGPPSSEPAPPGSMLDRVRQTTERAGELQGRTAALGASRILSLNDRATTPICGADYEIEVTSIAAGAGRVSLKPSGRVGAPVTLAAGEAPRAMTAGCRVALLSATDDLRNRRAQLRETRAE